MILKKQYPFWGVVLFLLFFVVSCNEKDPSYNRSNIKGTWVVDNYDGNKVTQNNKVVYIFKKDNVLDIEGVADLGEGNYKWGKSSGLYYFVYCCSLDISGKINNLMGFPPSVQISHRYDISAQTDSTLLIRPIQYSLNNVITDPGYALVGMNKVRKTISYADSLSGTWETATKNGVGFTACRFEFFKGGKYSFYTKDSEGVWSPKMDDDGTFVCYGDFLVLSFFNNFYFGKANKHNVSSWNISKASPKEGVMEWKSGEETISFIFISKP